MRIARVVGNVVSTIKDEGYHGRKLMLVAPLDENGGEDGPRQIVFDVADSGVGDIVLLLHDGGGSAIAMGGGDIVADMCIVGVIDHYDVHGQRHIGADR